MKALLIHLKIMFYTLYIYHALYFIRFAVKGRDCSTHDDCSAIDRTSCVKDPNDYKTRCLCGDDSPPMNGLCPDVLKGG